MAVLAANGSFCMFAVLEVPSWKKEGNSKSVTTTANIIACDNEECTEILLQSFVYLLTASEGIQDLDLDLMIESELGHVQRDENLFS